MAVPAVSTVPESAYEPELALLLLCARPESRAAAPLSLSVAARKVGDWERFFDLALYHGMLPLVYVLTHEHLDQKEHPILPEAVAARFSAAYKANAGRSLRYGTALVRAIEELARAGVPAIALKGPVLSAAAYGDPTLRTFSDLDVLVRPEHLERAMHALHTLGYTPRVAADAGYARHSLRARHHLSVHHPESGIVIELHWRLVRARLGLQLAVEEVFGRAETVSLLDRDFSSLAPVDQFLYMTVQAGKDGWARLERLRCLAEIVTQHPELDWSGVVRRAEERGSLKRTHVAILLTASDLGVLWDEQVLRESLADRRAVRLAREARAGWGDMRPLVAGRFGPARSRTASLDTYPAMVRYVLSLALEPNETDWAAVSLSPRLYPLYYFVRLGRLGARYARRALRRPR